MTPQLHWPVALVLLLLRGVLLWIVMPVGFVAWLLVHLWVQKAGLAECLGWYDSNLIAFLQRVVLRPIISKPTVAWVPVADMAGLTHRAGILDFS